MGSDAKDKVLQQIDLTKLNINQLHQLKQTIDQELNVFQDTIQTLKMAQGKFQNSHESLNTITPAMEGGTILVPLTSSMYVPGKLIDCKNVLLDVGTGYYVQKDMEDAKDYFIRKVNFVTEQMEKVQAIGTEKSKARDAVVEMIEVKVQAHLAASQQLAKEQNSSSS